MARSRMFRVFFFAAFAFAAWELLRILAPFTMALIGAAVLALVVFPAHQGLARRLSAAPTVAAGLSTILLILTVVLPSLSLGWVAVRQTSKLAPAAGAWVRERGGFTSQAMLEMLPPGGREAVAMAAEFVRSRGVDPKQVFEENLNELSMTMTSLAGHVLRNLLFFLFDLLVLTVALFFFLRDGADFVQQGLELVPLPPEHKKALTDRLQTTLLAVVRGIFIVSAGQGLLAAVGFALFGVPFAVLLGSLAGFLAPIPIVGTAGVWVPVVLGLFAAGESSKALGVAAWFIIVVGFLEHVVRPVLISAEARLPALFLFFGMLGGLHVYGFAGLLIGPVVVALFLAFADIYRREYRWLLAPGQEDA